MKIIGDPHLGREFKAYVPLDRRGEREEMMFVEFDKQLTTPEKLVICIGDLFDSPRIRFDHALRAIDIIIQHAQSHPDKKYIFIAGNHDISPNNIIGAFELLELATRLVENVYIIRRPTTLCNINFFPWEWGKTALEQLDDIHMWTDTAVGHWDLVDYGGSTDHLCPADSLKEKGVKRIVSGHWHLAGTYTVGDTDVECTGSMQPMTHAEDPEGKMYVTLTAEEYEASDPDSFANKYVRVTGDKGISVTPPPTCLGFKIQTQAKEQEEQERVTLGDFDIDKIIAKQLKAHEVPQEVQKEIKEHLSGIA
jgi:DNA repair exonuclease SbcCD nuclease subunit